MEYSEQEYIVRKYKKKLLTGITIIGATLALGIAIGITFSSSGIPVSRNLI